MGETESQLTTFWHQRRLSVADGVAFRLSCWPQVSHENLPVLKAVDKTMDCSLHTEMRTPLLRTTPTQLIEHGEVELIPTWSIQPYILMSLVWEGTLQATKRETSAAIQSQIFVLQSVLLA